MGKRSRAYRGEDSAAWKARKAETRGMSASEITAAARGNWCIECWHAFREGEDKKVALLAEISHVTGRPTGEQVAIGPLCVPCYAVLAAKVEKDGIQGALDWLERRPIATNK